MGAETGRRRGRRVVLISESDGLAGLLKYLLGRGHQLTRVGTPPEAIERGGLDEADTVVLDLPGDGSDTDIVRLRHNYRGPLVVIVDRGYSSAGQPADWAWTLVRRPFPAGDLAAALGLPGHRPVRSAPPGGTDGARIPPVGDRVPPLAERLRPLAERVATQTALVTPVAGQAGSGAAAGGGKAAAGGDLKAGARRAPSFVGAAVAESARDGVGLAVARVLAALTQGWQARRRVRVAGFSALSVVAFTVAFTMAAEDRCGPGCDALGTATAPPPTVAADAPQPRLTTAATRTRTPSTTAPAGAAPATATFRGDVAPADGGEVATTTSGPRATTTTRRPNPGGGGAPPPTTPTTRPATTQTTLAPTTTEAPTTTTTEAPPPPAP